jgi:hypothetical protein
MSAVDSIASALARFGRPMKLRRLVPGGDPIEIIIQGTTDGATISRIIGAIVQSDTHVIFSNIDIAAQNWPGPPKRGDKMTIDGAIRTLQTSEPKYLGTEILVHLADIRG